MTRAHLSPVLATATAVFYAAGYPVGALAVRAAAPGVVLVSRFAVSAVLLAVIARVAGLAWPHRADLKHAVVVGLLTQGVQFVGCYQAMYSGVSPVLVALVIAMNPVVTAVAAPALLSHRISGRSVVAVVLAFLAVGCAFAGRLIRVGHIDLAVLWVVAAVLGLSLGGVYQDRHLSSGHPISNNAIGSAVAVVPAGVFASLTSHAVPHPGRAVAMIAILIVANSIIATTLYMAAIRQAGAAAVSLLFGVIPSVAALISWLALDERPDLGVILGLALGALACRIGATAPAASPSTSRR